MKMGICSRALVLAGTVLLTACNEPVASDVPRTQVPLSERQGLQAAPARKLDFGSDCTAFAGNEGCVSDLCLRLNPGFPPRGVCSQKCSPTDDRSCPIRNGTRWDCKQVWPSETGWVCAPPRGAAEFAVPQAGDGGSP